MATPIRVSSADVADQDGNLLAEDAQVVVRQGVAKVTRRRELLLDRTVANVVRVARKEWRLEFADGTSWSVTKKPCGCSG